MLIATALQSHGFGAEGLALGGGGGGCGALKTGGAPPLVVLGAPPLVVLGAPPLVVLAPWAIAIILINNNIATNNLFIFPQKNYFFF
jgi:hypothetical protein